MHDLGMGRHADLVGQAFHHVERPAEQRAGDIHLVFIERGNRLRGQNQAGCTPITSAISSAVACALGHAEIMPGMARQQQHADAVGPGDLAAMDRDVLDAGLRIARDQQRRQ